MPELLIEISFHCPNSFHLSLNASSMHLSVVKLSARVTYLRYVFILLVAMRACCLILF
jgi:hypothetical protein